MLKLLGSLIICSIHIFDWTLIPKFYEVWQYDIFLEHTLSLLVHGLFPPQLNLKWEGREEQSEMGVKESEAGIARVLTSMYLHEERGGWNPRRGRGERWWRFLSSDLNCRESGEGQQRDSDNNGRVVGHKGDKSMTRVERWGTSLSLWWVRGLDATKKWNNIINTKKSLF